LPVAWKESEDLRRHIPLSIPILQVTNQFVWLNLSGTTKSMMVAHRVMNQPTYSLTNITTGDPMGFICFSWGHIRTHPYAF